MLIKNDKQKDYEQIRQMKFQSHIPHECLFCHRMTPQKKHLFFVLLKKLSKELTSITVKQENKTVENDYYSFKQLLRIIFGCEASDYESICQHKKYYVYYIQKLNCTEQDFNYATNKLSQTFAQQNYHLYLLSNQIKNSAQSIAQGRIEIDKSADQPSFYHNKQERMRNTRKRRSQAFSHIEQKGELQEKDERKQGGQQDQGVMNSMSYMPVYNSQLMIEPSPTSISLNSINNGVYYYQFPIFFTQHEQ